MRGRDYLVRRGLELKTSDLRDLSGDLHIEALLRVQAL